MTYKFSTMTTEQFNEQDMDKFIDYFNNVWNSKEPFTVQLDSKDIELHLVIEHMDLSEYMEDTLTQEISIGVIPTFDSLSDKNKNRILRSIQQTKKREC